MFGDNRLRRKLDPCLERTAYGALRMPPAAADDISFRAVALPRRIAFSLGGPLANLGAWIPLFATLNAAEQGFSLPGTFVAPLLQTAEMAGRVLLWPPAAFTQSDSVTGLVGVVVEGGRLVGAGMGLEFAILLSVSPALLDLLPVRVLDGGQILLSRLEEVWPRMIRMRVPLPLAAVVVLAAVVLYVHAQDVLRYWG